MSRKFDTIRNVAFTIAVGTMLAATGHAGTGAAPASANVLAGRAGVYEDLAADSLEEASTPDAIAAVARGTSAPTKIWRVLEHGEKVECLSCIPVVSKLLFDGNQKTREISAWWLRRRIFGVFGPGQVYSQLIDAVQSGATEDRRAYAAEALGEFLLRDGIAPVARAVVSDQSPRVRLSAVRALERLNSEGPAAELAVALADASPEVRLAALGAALRVNSFSRVDAIAERLGDSDASVRRRAADVIGSLRLGDAVVGLVALTTPEREPDAAVRTAAVSALGKIGDPAARDEVEAAQSDPDPLVQSAARIALRRL